MRGWCGGGVHAVIGGKPHDIDGDGPTGEQREHPDVPDGPGAPPWPPTAHPPHSLQTPGQRAPNPMHTLAPPDAHAALTTVHGPRLAQTRARPRLWGV